MSVPVFFRGWVCIFFFVNVNPQRGLLSGAWKIANSMDSQEFWNPLTDKALDLLDIDIAIRVYRQLKVRFF